RAKHRAERGSDIFESESLVILNKKLFKEKGALITRNVFIIKQNHELKNEIYKFEEKNRERFD
ncbi:unnamed protein product, partial [marine sediment metagenome]